MLPSEMLGTQVDAHLPQDGVCPTFPVSHSAGCTVVSQRGFSLRSSDKS